jgi:hypothetical protein
MTAVIQNRQPGESGQLFFPMARGDKIGTKYAYKWVD